MPRVRKTRDHAKTVTVYDPERRESVSFTCYSAGQPAFEVARLVRNALPVGWSATSLTDRRHKRR